MKHFLEKIFLLLICLFLISCITDFKSNNLPFNSEQWKNGDLRMRGQMVENLAKGKVLEGKTINEVKDLIGEPFHINSMRDNIESWSYKTDKGYKVFGDDIWIHWFHVDFSKQNGTVMKTYLTD
jgi:hypothetical protein